MNSVQVFVVIFAVFSCIAVGVSGHHKMKCMDKEITLNDDTKAAMKTCYEANKPEEGSKKPKPCMLPCIYDKLTCVKDNKFDMDCFKSKIVPQFPEEAREKIIAGNQACVDSHGATSLSMDDDCKSWTDFVKCSFKSQKEICGAGCGMENE